MGEKNIDFGGVADLYDTYVQWEEDVPFFLEACRGARGEVLELMSGTGRLSLPLARAGVRLVCVDYSAEMLAVLKRKLRAEGLEADVIEADVRELNLGREFERVLLPFHSLSELRSRADRVRALARIAAHLAAGGRAYVTLQNPAVQVPRLDGERRLICDRGLEGREARLKVWSTARFVAARSEGEALQEYEVVDGAGRVVERRELRLGFAVIGPGEFETEAAEAGLARVRVWGGYGRAAFDPERSPFHLWEMERSASHGSNRS